MAAGLACLLCLASENGYTAGFNGMFYNSRPHCLCCLVSFFITDHLLQLTLSFLLCASANQTSVDHDRALFWNFFTSWLLLPVHHCRWFSSCLVYSIAHVGGVLLKSVPLEIINDPVHTPRNDWRELWANQRKFSRKKNRRSPITPLFQRRLLRCPLYKFQARLRHVQFQRLVE